MARADPGSLFLNTKLPPYRRYEELQGAGKGEVLAWDQTWLQALIHPILTV